MAQTSSVQTVQQLLPLFGHRLLGPDTAAHQAGNKGQRQPLLSSLHGLRLSLASGCTPIKPIAGK